MFCDREDYSPTALLSDGREVGSWSVVVTTRCPERYSLAGKVVRRWLRSGPSIRPADRDVVESFVSALDCDVSEVVEMSGGGPPSDLGMAVLKAIRDAE